jgi:hypothetical protein
LGAALARTRWQARPRAGLRRSPRAAGVPTPASRGSAASPPTRGPEQNRPKPTNFTHAALNCTAAFRHPGRVIAGGEGCRASFRAGMELPAMPLARLYDKHAEEMRLRRRADRRPQTPRLAPQARRRMATRRRRTTQSAASPPHRLTNQDASGAYCRRAQSTETTLSAHGTSGKIPQYRQNPHIAVSAA